VRLALAVLLAAGCGGAPSAVRDTASIAAQGVQAVSEELPPFYAAKAETCRVQSSDWAEYDQCLAPVVAVFDARDAAKEVLLTMDVAADSWDAAAEADWPRLAACAVVALTGLARAVQVAGISIPGAIVDALALAEGFGGACGGS